MHKHKIGISISSNYPCPVDDIIKIVKKVGFDAISPEWNEGVDLEKIIKVAIDNNLTIQSLHAPYKKSADMWSLDDNLSSHAKRELLSALDACVRFNIPILVVHAWIGFDYTFSNNALNYKNFDEIIQYAKERHVKVAFENTEGEEYLFALMDHFNGNDTVGFCWDSGHELCYNHSEDLLAKFGDRLIMTHLNDNLGISSLDGNIFWTDDLHLLPFDGISDWAYNIKRLNKSQGLDILNFELKIHSKPNRHENDVYITMGMENYFAEAYKRACKIVNGYQKEEKA